MCGYSERQPLSRLECEDSFPCALVHGHVDAPRTAGCMVCIDCRPQRRHLFVEWCDLCQVRPDYQKYACLAQEARCFSLLIPLNCATRRVFHVLNAHFSQRCAIAPARMDVFGIDIYWPW